jgi:Domain of unknown function (DUF1841)
MVAGQSKGLPVRHARTRDSAVSTTGAGRCVTATGCPTVIVKTALGDRWPSGHPDLVGWPGSPQRQCAVPPGGRGLPRPVMGGEPVNPWLHVAMHQVVANQLLAGDPPETWQTVQRLAGLGYDWHNIMHMIASLITEDVYSALKEDRQPDPGPYARRLGGLHGDWPPPEPAR